MSGPRYSIIPAGAVTDDTLEPRDLQVLCLLGRHIDDLGWCRRSQVKMSRELKCGRATVQRSLERLYEAGWVQKKRRDVDADEDSQPSLSFAYRVLLDRDEEIAPLNDRKSVSDLEDGVPMDEHPLPIDGHPGAHTERARGAHTYVGTKNVPLERPHLEPERDARGRGDERARFIVDFEARWPTSVGDSRQKTAYAAEALTPDERKAALAGIQPFLAYMKKIGRKGIPAGSTYLEEKRWTLLEAQVATSAVVASVYVAGSAEARAISGIFEVAGNGDFLRMTRRSKVDGSISFNLPVTPRLMALATMPARDAWVALNAQQAAAWEGFICEFVKLAVRRRLGEGSVAPWPWPPKKDGGLYDARNSSGGDEVDDAQALADEGRTT